MTCANTHPYTSSEQYREPVWTIFAKLTDRYIHGSEATTTGRLTTVVRHQQARAPKILLLADHFVTSEYEVTLTRSPEVTLKVENDLYVIESQNLDIVSYGTTTMEAMNSFYDDMLYFYNHYYEIKDECLLGNALRRKQQLINIVKRVLPREGVQG